jgi:hypothetical protein
LCDAVGGVLITLFCSKNRVDISQNKADISKNTFDISQNKADISENTFDITLIKDDITDISSNKDFIRHFQSIDYSGLGHRVPGESPYMGPVQDWRYYVGYALSDAEIKKIAQMSQDENGNMLRTCTDDDAF